MSKITLFRNYSDNRDLNKNISNYIYGSNNIVNCDIVYPCSTMYPTFRLGSADFDITKCNYLFSETFGRYYYITDITLLNHGIVEIKCKCDVLMSFSDGIRNLRTIVKRAEDVSLCNPKIPDEKIVGRIDRQVKRIPVGAVGGSATGTHIVLTTTGGDN